MKKFNWAWTQFSVRHSCMQVVCSHPSSALSSSIWARNLHSLVCGVKESLLVSSLTHHKMNNSIYSTTSLYNFPIWDILFPFYFSNSMSILWVTISHSSINHFEHINIRNWSSHRGKQLSSLTQQKSLVGLT